jgi:hypothetical protein
MVVKLGICVAYDWELLAYSLPAIYKHVNAICLSVDVDCKSWSGNNFEIDWKGLNKLVEEIDADGKIMILRESFYNINRSPIANECFQRERMATVLGKADWIVQIDTDEIFINVEDFFECLRKHTGTKRPMNIHGMWINLIKQTRAGYIYSVLKTPPLATNYPSYEYGRTNSNFNVYTNSFLVHITWARPVEEIRQKLANWGHSNELKSEGFLKIWEALDDTNWMYIKNFHPMFDSRIKEVFHVSATSIDSLMTNEFYKSHALKKKHLKMNNIWYSRASKIWRRLNKHSQ